MTMYRWARLDGPVHDVFAGLNVVLATKGAAHDVYKYTTWEVPVTPVRIGGPGATFAIANQDVYALSPDRQAVMQFAGLPDNWVRIGGAAATIVAGAAGLFATHPKTGRIYRYDGTPDRWTHVGEAGAMFAVGDRLYGLTPDRQAVFEYAGTPGGWVRIGGPAAVIVAGADQLIATNPRTGAVYRYEGVPDRWRAIGVPADSFVVNDAGIFALALDKQSVNEYVSDFEGARWIQRGGPADRIFGGGPYLCVLSPRTHELWYTAILRGWPLPAVGG